MLAISYFPDEALLDILTAVRAASRPAGTQILIGTYGLDQGLSDELLSIGTDCYAPIVGVEPANSQAQRAERQLSTSERSLVSPAYSGAFPADPQFPVLPRANEGPWGLELGRRFRDSLRSARANGMIVPHWQFDEILGQCGIAVAGSRWRIFITGVLQGLAQGRSELGDVKESGLVWIAWEALGVLPSMAINSELTAFWKAVDSAALMLVGEEYPRFEGDAAATAATYAAPHRALAQSSGPIRKALGGRYMVGMTPGWIPNPDLGGNVNNEPAAWVTQWRSEFIASRKNLAVPAGFAQFDFSNENNDSEHIADAVASLHETIEALVGLDAGPAEDSSASARPGP